MNDKINIKLIIMLSSRCFHLSRRLYQDRKIPSVKIIELNNISICDSQKKKLLELLAEMKCNKKSNKIDLDTFKSLEILIKNQAEKLYQNIYQ